MVVDEMDSVSIREIGMKIISRIIQRESWYIIVEIVSEMNEPSERTRFRFITRVNVISCGRLK